MRVIEITEFGPPEVLKLATRPAPEPGRLEVLVKVDAAGVNRPDVQQRLTITGSTLRARAPEEKGAIARALHAEVWPLLEAGTVKPLVHAVFPLARAADAHRMMDARGHFGTIVLDVTAQ